MPTLKARRPSQDPDLNLERDAIALHAALSNLVRVYQFRDRDQICCYDISVTQCYALETLVEQGPMRSKSLSDALKLDKSTTTRVVDALVRKDYVARLPDADDARAVSLKVTASGRRLYERINGALIAQQADLLRGLEPGVRAAATEVIRRLAKAAEARFVSGVSVGSCESACAAGSKSKTTCS
ncbi:MarR family transcriptional regulator [Ahniella affigens]|uniref:MarR family transcriptional regulator n=1 Tax=Ahniella affigens TaxID=2021234 RepID=A0A2P1PN34_9GAMM|nr:MarR family transcriptional regulator [Ahniella affigens]AVP96249.1 MarR family transcriptional regulator [Ahniella affigens]